MVVRICKVRSVSYRFNVNLSCGAGLGTTADVALHVNPRFDSGPAVLVRNSLINGSWGPEERGGPYFPLLPGFQFEMIILATSNHYKVLSISLCLFITDY